VSIFFKNQWQEWAREWGLTHYPHKGWASKNEHVIGKRKGLLIRAGWGADQSPLIVCIRFPRTANLERLRNALIDDASLDALPGKGSARRKMEVESGAKKVIRIGNPPEFRLTDTSLIWYRTFSLMAPKPKQVQEWVDALVVAVGRAVPAFDGHCECCATGMAKDYVVVDELPTWLCNNCVQKLKTEGDMADRTYDMSEARHVPGALLAVVAAIVGAAAWAALGVITDRTYALVAIGIGLLVAVAYRKGAGRVDGLGRAIAGFLTLASVVLGQVSLYAWWVSKERPDVGFNLDAGLHVYLRAWALKPGSEVITLLFALLGAWYATRALQRPKLHANIESADSSGVEQKAA
jgi:hypothetical protein